MAMAVGLIFFKKLIQQILKIILLMHVSNYNQLYHKSNTKWEQKTPSTL